MSVPKIVTLFGSSAANLNTTDLTQEHDVFLRSQLQRLSSRDYQLSIQSLNNIRAAVEGLRGQGNPRKFVKSCWRRALDISPQAFVLLTVSFTHHNLLRRGQHACQQLIDFLRRNQGTIDGHPRLSFLTSQYFGVNTKLAPGVVSESLSCTGLSHRHVLGIEMHTKPQEVWPEPFEPLTIQKEPTASSWLDYFCNEPAFMIHLGPVFNHSKLRQLTCATEDLQTLWRTHTTCLPVIVPSVACWRGPPPAFEQLWVEASKMKASDLRVYEQGEKSSNATLAFCQMARPNPDNPTCIIGMEPPALVRSRKFGSCAQLHQHVTTYLEQSTVFNMTPKFSFVDLHIDYGRDGISATLHECEKVWVMYPPTPHNLQWMAEHRGQQAKLAQGMAVLEGGVVVHTTSAEAVYLPASCLHAVFTIEGGFLVSIDCTTRMSVWPFAQYLRYNAQAEFEAKEQRNCYFLFLDSLNVALQNAGERDGLRAWIEVADCLQKRMKDDRTWMRAASKVWEDYLKTGRVVDLECPCKGAVSSSFLEHLMDRHLRWLLDDRRRLRNDIANNPAHRQREG